MEHSAKIVVPDYIADGIIFFDDKYRSVDEEDPYQKIVNVKLFGRYTIGAVLKTNYKEKYGSFMDTVMRIKREPQHAKQLKDAITNSELFSKFLSDASAYLNYAYTLNPNYRDVLHEISPVRYMHKCAYSLEGDDKEYKFSSEQYSMYPSKKLYNKEATMEINLYNEIFGTNCTSPTSSDFKERDMTIHKYSYVSRTEDIHMDQITVHITGIYVAKESWNKLTISQELFNKTVDWDFFQYGWVFDEPHQCYDLYQKLSPYYFYNHVACFDAVYTTIGIITIFSEIFSILLYLFIACLFLIIIMHNLRVVRNETYRFGVLKSLGYSNLYLAITVTFMNILSVVLIFGLSTVFSWGLGVLANRLIQFGFAKFMNNIIYYSITMLTYDIKYTLIYSLVVLGIMMVTLFVPLLAIRKIKPSKIIRNAE